MKEKVNVFAYAERIVKMLPDGILLNPQGEKFNSMVIGWGHLGVIWGLPTFTVYVRQSRYTKPQLDRTGEFTVSVPPEGKLDPEVFRVCGVLSGRDTDKEKAAHLTLVKGESVSVPGILEYPLTLECRVLYRQDQVLSELPPEIRHRYYARCTDDGDFHTAYIGEIVNAYIIRDEA